MEGASGGGDGGGVFWTEEFSITNKEEIHREVEGSERKRREVREKREERERENRMNLVFAENELVAV